MNMHNNVVSLLISVTDFKIIVKMRKKARIRNRYNRVPHQSQDTTWESDKNTRKHHIQENQEVSSFPVGGHKVTMNRQDSITEMKHK